MTRGVVEGKVLDAEARFRISIDINKQHRFVHRIEDFEKNFVVEKKKKNYPASRSLRVYSRPLFLRSSLGSCDDIAPLSSKVCTVEKHNKSRFFPSLLCSTR